MHVLITGGTGFIGRALVPVLRRRGHTILVWTRSATRARERLGAEIETVDAGGGARALVDAVTQADAVINLAGAPIIAHRWTAAQRSVLRDSRIDLTERLVQAIASTRRRPRVLVSASAVGYYGHRGAEILNEDSRPGTDFLGQLGQGWEAAARKAESLSVRVARVRLGVVLGRDGGALASLLPLFRLGLGGTIGSGQQYFPWIHLHDAANILLGAITDDRFDGPINGVAPEAITNREFARAMGRAVRRPAGVRTPASALRIFLGEASAVLLASQRVQPAALEQLGFRFAFPTLDAALADIVGGSPVVVRRLTGAIDPKGSESARRYLAQRPPLFELRTTTIVKAPIEETFTFFSKAENLGALTPSAMRFSIAGAPPRLTEDATIHYRFRVGPIPIAWRSRIVGWRPDAGFVDFQEQGPYRTWWHEHSFRQDGTSTLMEDRVCYAPPFWWLGRLANRLFIIPTLRRIFQYRSDVIRLRFGEA